MGLHRLHSLSFNSSMVRLGEYFVMGIRNVDFSFNSSMVRLGECPPINSYAQRSGVSIPVWFDWEPGAEVKSRYNGSVSIPVWFDWEV